MFSMAKVEGNVGKSILVTTKTVLGYGDHLSIVLFLIRSKPLNRLILAKFPEIMYITNKGRTVGPILFADNNLLPLKF
jgi:hypothetical protein